MVVAAHVVLIVAAERVLVEEGDLESHLTQAVSGDPCPLRGAAGAYWKGAALVHGIVRDVENVHFLPRPRILPLAQNLARGRVLIEHDFARHHLVALLTLLIHHCLRGADVHGMPGEEKTVALAGNARVCLPPEVEDHRLAVDGRRLHLAICRDHVLGLREVEPGGRRGRRHLLLLNGEGRCRQDKDGDGDQGVGSHGWPFGSLDGESEKGGQDLRFRNNGAEAPGLVSMTIDLGSV